jgi:uncharacterized membrane protein YkoI
MNRVPAIAVCAALMAGLAQPAVAQTCHSDWSVAAPIVRKEGLATVEQLAAMAKAKGHGAIVQTQLCEDKGSYSYRVTVRDPKGSLRSVTTDAKKPFER